MGIISNIKVKHEQDQDEFGKLISKICTVVF